MEWKKRIHTNKKILGGKPVIKGTRLSVDFIMSLKAMGWTEQQILRNYENLTKEDLQAVFAYAYAYAYAYECLNDTNFFIPNKSA